MKPKNNFQKQVAEASKNLAPISQEQVEWGYRKCITHIGRRTKKGAITRLECSHSWTDKVAKKCCVCPQCGTKLAIEDTVMRVFKDWQYLCIITAYEGFQVLRFIYIHCSMKVGEKAHYFHSEVVQRWIAPNGKFATIAKLRPMGCYYTCYDTWMFSSALEIRLEKLLYDITPAAVYPKQLLIPETKRGGYKRLLHGMSPFKLFHFLLSESKAETLLKTGQVELFKYFSIQRNSLNYYWGSIRICIRNGYRISDAAIWRDYVDLLEFFGKDLHNRKYVCPADLKAEHDKYMKKKRERNIQEKKKENQERLLSEKAQFSEMKSKFFGVRFSDELIEVSVLDSVEEVLMEGVALHHCVFENRYHLKSNSLILSARVNGERMETVELSLTEWRMLQSRGVCNKNTKYHDRIVRLVEKYVPLIQKRMVA